MTDAELMPAFLHKSFFFISLSTRNFQSFFITDSHKIIPLYLVIQKMLCRLAEHRVYIAILPRPITTLTALYTKIAHSVRKCKIMIDSSLFLPFALCADGGTFVNFTKRLWQVERLRKVLFLLIDLVVLLCYTFYGHSSTNEEDICE